MVIFVFNELKQEVIDYFVDIGGIVDHHCLYFPFFKLHTKNVTKYLIIQYYRCQFNRGINYIHSFIYGKSNRYSNFNHCLQEITSYCLP